MQARSASLRQRARLAGGLREGRALRKNLLQATLVHCPLVLFIDLPLESIWSRIGHFYISADNSGGSRPWAKGGLRFSWVIWFAYRLPCWLFFLLHFFIILIFFVFAKIRGGPGSLGPSPRSATGQRCLLVEFQCPVLFSVSFPAGFWKKPRPLLRPRILTSGYPRGRETCSSVVL